MKYDFLIIGAGIFGSVCARELTDKGFSCLVLEKRDHIGGNCYTYKESKIDIHKYGAHIFHTSSEKIWNYINKFSKFNNYRHSVVANYQNKIIPLPFNMWTFNSIWGAITPTEAIGIINSQKFHGTPSNLEEQAISMVGKDIYEILIKGYTKKQWMKDPKFLPKEIIKRIPIKFIYNNDYFDDQFQGIPTDGYTKIFENMLDGIDVQLDSDYFENRNFYDQLARYKIYSGPIDRYYDYTYGKLEYRSLNFQHETLSIENYQGSSVVNYTDESIPFTRILEHKHFNPNNKSDKTIITKEFSISWTGAEDPIYPINDTTNNDIYKKYKDIPNSKTIFGGRLAEYRYYDMHQVIGSALSTVSQIIK
jgi:UDP-galactopyranose mutase